MGRRRRDAPRQNQSSAVSSMDASEPDLRSYSKAADYAYIRQVVDVLREAAEADDSALDRYRAI